MMKLIRKIQYNSPVILTFAFLSFLVLILGALTKGASTARIFSVYRAPFTDPLTYLRFFTHVLGHGNYAHYIGNMVLMLVIGPSLEDKYGSVNLLLGMALTAVVTGLLQFGLFPGHGLLGASGIVYMMIVLSSFFGRREGKIPLTLILVMILYLGNEIVTGISAQDNISQFTHVAGGLCGLVLGFLFDKRRASLDSI